MIDDIHILANQIARQRGVAVEAMQQAVEAAKEAIETVLRTVREEVSIPQTRREEVSIHQMIKIEVTANKFALWYEDLVFLPHPKLFYDQYLWSEDGAVKKKPKDRYPIEFMHQQYEQYISRHLLYSGHVNRVDLKLYKALEYVVARDGKYSSILEFFSKQGILTADDFADPSPKYPLEIDIIRHVNGLLAQEHMTRLAAGRFAHMHRTPRQARL